MSLILAIVGKFVPAPLVNLAAWALIALAVSGAALGGYQLVKHWGAEELRAKIEKENQDAIRKGIEAARSFDACIDAGGVWDFRRKRCSGATLGPR